MSGIQATAVAKYVLLPGIFPRLKQLLASGFGYIAFLMAQIYFMVRLLPVGHAYLDPRNVGRFGIRHVIAEAANGLVLSKKNIDQIIVFFLMLTGIVLLLCQIAALIFSMLFSPAMATSIFVTAAPTFDIAFILLDQVFGVGNFFNSCVSQNVSCDPTGTLPAPVGVYPWPFHLALQNMFRFYSLGILVIGTIIFLYFVMVIVVETATTGTPFGQRFQNVWAPIRLVVAVGLLIPLGFGYNSGQYITFASAKYGSSLATNAWNTYNNTIAARMTGTGNPSGEDQNLISFPKPPDAGVMAEFMSLIHTCAFAEYYYHDDIKKNGRGLTAGQIDIPWPDPPGAIQAYQTNQYAIRAYLVKNPTQWQTNLGGLAASSVAEIVHGSVTGSGAVPDTVSTYQQAMQFFTRGDIVIRFGRYDPAKYDEHTGNVEPTCGDIRIPITDKRDINASGNHIPAAGAPNMGYLGGPMVQQTFFNYIIDRWAQTAQSEEYIDFAGRSVMLKANLQNEAGGTPITACEMGCNGGGNPLLPGCTGVAAGNKPDTNPPVPWSSLTPPPPPCEVLFPAALWKQTIINNLQRQMNNDLTQIWNNYNAGTREFDMDPQLLSRGWGGAGIWFNTIAKVNGGFITAMANFPGVDSYPLLMEKVSKEKDKKDADPSGIEQFNPNASKAGGAVELPGNVDNKSMAIAMYYVFEYWNKDNKNMANAEKAITSGALETGMNLVFGTHGLFAMTDENANIHPLAQLVALGKGLVDSSIRNVAGSTMTAAMGGLSKALDNQAGPLMNAASGLLMSTAFIGLTAGFVLYYVLPFLPFVYFYFAVASWVKTIFEAMVGVPLWALAHLRLDGDGLPGESAANGYFLIFEIFVRPVLSVAGLVAAMLIFTAQVRVLNFIWPLVTENVGGHNSNPTIGIGGNINFKRSIIDEFFYTVIYAIIVYMLATSSFKLIDKIPDNILRWMGQGVSSFGDINQDPAEGLTKYAALGGMTAGQKIAGGVKDLGGGLGGAIGKEFSDIRLKENIEHIGYEMGIPIYSFSYIGEAQRYKGVMAQDILKLKPEAVVTIDGYLAVHYDQIGIEMQPLEDYMKEQATNDS